eukprot:201266-Prymnesium_polylepis.1
MGGQCTCGMMMICALARRHKAALQGRPLPASVRAELLVIEVPQPANAQNRVRHRCGSSMVAQHSCGRAICTRRQGRDCGSPGLRRESVHRLGRNLNVALERGLRH